ncbi:hypothetical protein [Oleidesulfovibrio sp.]|uniref:hypothetical protein n=1 Tax=Oleidesulfovibrio sp. TaxID=2909707 RepID=UPI003A88133C
MTTHEAGSERQRHPVDALATFLEDKARHIRTIEQHANEVLHEQNDQAGYRALLSQKAELLAALPDDAEHYVTALPDAIARSVQERLNRFALSASNALRIGSIFYMSALLYPEDHKQGAKNDLELYADEVRDIRY